MKWRVSGKVVASTFVGTYEADTKEAAEELAWPDAFVSVCHQCSDKLDSPEVIELTVEPDDA